VPGGVAEDWVVEWGAPQESVSRVRVRAIARAVDAARLVLGCIPRGWWPRVRRLASLG
jgi:hypothetical protein